MGALAVYHVGKEYLYIQWAEHIHMHIINIIMMNITIVIIIIIIIITIFNIISAHF